MEKAAYITASQNDHVTGVVESTSSHGTILDTIYCSPKCRDKVRNHQNYLARKAAKLQSLPQRNDIMPSTQNERAKSPPTDTKKKRLTVNLPIETHNDFKAWCSQQGREMSDVIVEFVEQCIKKTSK